MKTKDFTIHTKLRIGFGLLFLFVVVLGTTAYLQVKIMWQETKGLYEHPLHVRRALGDLRADIFAMQGAMKGLVLVDSESERLHVIQQIDTWEANAHQQFGIIYDRYLGPRKDVDHAYESFTQWKALREGAVRLLLAGTTLETSNIAKSMRLSDAHILNLLKEIQDISDFALARGDKFFQDAELHKNDMVMRLWILMGAILLSSWAISYILLKGIRVPLEELTSVTKRFSQGYLDARCQYVSPNEFGVLAALFNNLAEVIQAEMQSRESVAKLADVMLREEDLPSFCHVLLQCLIDHTDSRVAAVYIPNKEKTHFEHFQSIGLSEDRRTSFSALAYEGEFGAALATRRIQHITEIPADTRLIFSTVTGDFNPREIMTIPILSNDDVLAVISLASLRSYTASTIRLINDIWGVLNARMNGVLAYRKIREFSERLEKQNCELEQQSRELAVQKDELLEQNIELEMQKRQLDESSRLKSVFLSNMSHELRTPLNSVIALSGVLSRRLQGVIATEEYSYLDVIERNGRLLLALINDILDLSRIEAGREEINLSRFSLRELVNEVVTMIEPQAREKNIALLNQVGSESPHLTSDYSKCRHILQNIVGNAVKFTSEGKVEISAREGDHGVLITVADTGIGIAEEQQAHVFDEFRQADEGTSRRFGGTGLGLSIARKYSKMLGGNIALASTPGKGSTFTVTLPLEMVLPPSGEQATPPLPRIEPVDSNEPSSLQAANDRVILVVEDSEPAVIQIRDILTEEGYRVQVARNGNEALEQIEKAVPDAVILDLMMPEVDGFQVLRTIRGAEKTARLPVLILTAKHITKDDLKFLRGNHIHQLVQKGDIGKKELLTSVKKMVLPSPEKPIRMVSAGKPLILVVEDNPDNMKTVKAMLQDSCSLIEAADGQTGVQLARMHKPDLILLDISLPVLDGFKVLDAIRKEELLRHIPIIALTARAMKGDREEIMNHGFDGYITKPIDEGSLKKTIEEIIHAR